MTTIRATKFQQMLTKGFQDHLVVAKDPRDPKRRRYFIKSRRSDAVYVVTPATCTCAAGMRDKPCVHRARAIYESGLHTSPIYVCDDAGQAVVWTVSPVEV